MKSNNYLYDSEKNDIVQTYPFSEMEGRFETYYELADGTWKTDDYHYKYKLVLTGRFHNAASDTTIICLSNSTDITFSTIADSFYSSKAGKPYKREDLVLVEMVD